MTQSQPALDARFLGQEVPESFICGRAQRVRLSFLNSGSVAWGGETFVALAWQGPEGRQPWGDNQVYLEAGERVEPGQVKDFEWDVIPLAGPGSYPFAWRLLDCKSGLAFGQSSQVLELPLSEPSLPIPAGPLMLRRAASELGPAGFEGFGFEWDPGFWRGEGGPQAEAAWETVKARLAWMRPPLLRMMFRVGWFARPGGGRDFSSPAMRDLERHLEACQELGIRVVLTEWGPGAWPEEPAFKPKDPEYPLAVAEGLDHLIRARGYTCIRDLVHTNEPQDFLWEDWSAQWAGLRAALAARGLDAELRLCGPDSTNWPVGMDWFKRSLAEMPKAFQAWDIHRYHQAFDIKWGGLERAVRDGWRLAEAAGPARPRLMLEAGARGEGFAMKHNPLAEDHAYGLLMADYAVQALRAGTDAVLAWMFDDSSHEGFNWGMVRDRRAGHGPRPWFFIWSAIVRHFPAGSRFLHLDTGSPLARAMAARLPGGAWSILLVNHGPSVQAQLRLDGAPQQDFKRYSYQEGLAAFSPQGLPLSDAGFCAKLDPGFFLDLPSQSAILLSSAAV